MAWWLGGDLGSAGTLVWTSPQWLVLVAVAGALLAWVLALAGQRARHRWGRGLQPNLGHQLPWRG